MIETFERVVMCIMVCGTLLMLAFMVLLAMPKSKLRCVLLELVGWAMVVLAGVYVVSPIDVVPDFIPVLGQIDDVGALVAGAVAGVTAFGARADRRRLEEEES